MVTTSSECLRHLSALLCALAIIGSLSVTIDAQEPSSDQIKHAAERSENAATIISTVANLKNKGISKELIDKAQAIAVFPHVVKTNAVFAKTLVGYGVISRRLSAGWSLPAFYTFSGAALDLNVVGGTASDVIVLFMNDKAVNWITKDKLELEGEKRAFKGPVGSITESEKSKLERASIVMYVLSGGQLTSIETHGNLFNSYGIIPDNKLSKAIYKKKSGELLNEKESDQKGVSSDIRKYQQVLMQAFE